MLTQTLVKTLFNYYNGVLYWKISLNDKNQIGWKAGSMSGKYIRIQIHKKKYLAHRLIFLYHHGYLPKTIDHKDNNPTNNKIENLRECTRSENEGNSKTPKNNTSGYKGVMWHKQHQKWMAQIGVNYKRKHIGLYSTKEEAAKAYNQAAIQYFGEFAKLNEVLDNA